MPGWQGDAARKTAGMGRTWRIREGKACRRCRAHSLYDCHGSARACAWARPRRSMCIPQCATNPANTPQRSEHAERSAGERGAGEAGRVLEL